MLDPETLFRFNETSFTKTVHRDVYPAIDPTRQELSQRGKNILITGGGDNLGLSIAHAFVQACADTIILVGRRSDVLEHARSQLQADTKAAGGKTRILIHACDITDQAQLQTLWTELSNRLGIFVDVFVTNAAKPSQAKSILDSGTSDIWEQMETNVKGPLYMTEKLCAQPGQKQKFVVHVSSAAIHSYTHPAAAAHSGGTLTKATGTMMFQLIAMQNRNENLQVISFHPGLMYNQYFESLGLPKDRFSSRKLAAAFAVWASSKEASFLHGRFAWAAWDVDNLASGDIRKRIENDPYFLRNSILPLDQGYNAA